MLASLVLLCSLTAQAWTLRGPDGAHLDHEIVVSDVLVESEPAWQSARVSTEAADLGRIARATLERLRSHDDPRVAHAGLASELGITLEQVEATLDFVARVAEEDRGRAEQRLADPEFIHRHFRAVRWIGDSAAASERGVRLDDGRVRLTRYLVYRVSGRADQDAVHPNALYALPDDERGLSPAEAGRRRAELTRFQLTRQQVMDGALRQGDRAGMARPVVWLQRRHVHDALMQGTVEVALPDGTQRTYNVHRNNGIPWDPAAGPESQARYWYFREVPGPQGWGGEGARIPVVPWVTVAGDVYNHGLGKLFALHSTGPRGEELRLAVLADTGGAFQPNLFQLDLFTGAHDDREAFEAATAHVPRRVHASLLILRDPP